MEMHLLWGDYRSGDPGESVWVKETVTSGDRSPEEIDLKRIDYIEAFFKNTNWKTVEKRLG
jgi:hypothetical protein